MLEPFSLELGAGDQVFAFMERSPVNDPERAWGWALSRPAFRDNSSSAVDEPNTGTSAANVYSMRVAVYRYSRCAAAAK
jgi:hypothetical protein